MLFSAFCQAIFDDFFKVRQKLQTEKFDFDRFKRRHVLLRVSYFGWDYMGFATQVCLGIIHIRAEQEQFGKKK